MTDELILLNKFTREVLAAMTDHLFSTDDENMFIDIDEWFESRGDLYDQGDIVDIDEWSTHPPTAHLPIPEMILDWMIEQGADNETDEGWYEQAARVEHNEDVLTKAQELIDDIADRITYRMADNLLATHRIRITDDGWKFAGGNKP